MEGDIRPRTAIKGVSPGPILPCPIVSDILCKLWRSTLPPLLTHTICDDRYPLPPPTAFATGNRDPISGLCTLTYQTRKPPLSPKNFTTSSRATVTRSRLASALWGRSSTSSDRSRSASPCRRRKIYMRHREPSEPAETAWRSSRPANLLLAADQPSWWGVATLYRGHAAWLTADEKLALAAFWRAW